MNPNALETRNGKESENEQARARGRVEQFPSVPSLLEEDSHQEVENALDVRLLERRDIDSLGVITKPVSEVD